MSSMQFGKLPNSAVKATAGGGNRVRASVNLSTNHHLLPRQWYRNAKKATKVAVTDLPQGSLGAKAIEVGTGESGLAYPTVIQQARNHMRKFPHCVVLTRVGNFYELYFEHATEYAPLLGLKPGAVKKTNAGPVPMAGFPFFQLERYVKMLVQTLGRHVAIAEEFMVEPADKIKSSGLMFDRRVSRVITPGTLIDESFIEPWENNFLLSIRVDPSDAAGLTGRCNVAIRSPTERHEADVGLAWVDLTSGEFHTQRTHMSSLPSVVSRIAPREVIMDPTLESLGGSALVSALREDRHVITFHKMPLQPPYTEVDWVPKLQDVRPGFDASAFSRVEIDAASFLMHYVDTQLQGKYANLQSPVQQREEEYMMIDKNSVKALELKSTLADGAYEGSLLHSIRKTVTKSGARLLSQRLLSPSTSLGVVNGRLDLVGELIKNAHLRRDLVELLRKTHDSLRLVQKFAFGRGDADDLLELSKTVGITAVIAGMLSEHTGQTGHSTTTGKPVDSASSCLGNLSSSLSLEGPLVLSDRIRAAVDEESVSEQHRLEHSETASLVGLADHVLAEAGEGLEGIRRGVKSKLGDSGNKSGFVEADIWIMKKDASATLSRLHTELDKLLRQRAVLEQSLRVKASAESLTLRWTPGKGHICHVKGKDTKQISLSSIGFTRHAGSSQSTTSFYLPEWTALGSKTEEARLRIRVEEQRIFASLREGVIKNLVHLRSNARVMDELDVACGFATLAAENHWVRPALSNTTQHHIVGGRHPTVEAGLNRCGRQFTSNDCFVGSSVLAGDCQSTVAPSQSTTGTLPRAASEERILLITGPNMAGKSTYLRQNALISILAQAGSYVPAAYCSLGIVDAVFSRVGSADNLYLSQSTFMLEMLEAAHILRHATARSFVIMDEIGRGTTPEDGIAISYAVLWHIYHRNKCRTLFATHFHGVIDLVAGWEGVGCWSTDVVEEQNRDGTEGWAYVHKLKRGVNRKSHALKVARMAGLPEEAVEVAAACLYALKHGGVPDDAGT